MNDITIPVNVSPDILVTLNETEEELKSHFQVAVAMMLFQEGKLTIGKAIQLSGLTRYEFELSLAKNKISVSNLSFEEIINDLDKISHNK
jgi:predicted HTH domain antitoxin